MNDFSDPGTTILTVAIAAGWVAVAALVLQLFLKGLGRLVEGFSEKQSIKNPSGRDGKGFS